LEAKVWKERDLDRLARPLAEIDEHYEVVVVGSGYGGAIAACRLSRAGRRVALLERGREILPGEYPTTAIEALSQVQTTGPGLGPRQQIGDPRSLYWFHTDGPMNVFSGCGLGGTSLVNANVSLQPDQSVLADARWPAPLRGDPGGSLEAGYEEARSMLTPSTYPMSFPRLPKMDALRTAAGGHPVELTPINVTFRSGINGAGVYQEACVGCGDCVTGCNFGAKNTVLMNYLPDAAAHGAHIFTEIDVRTVEPANGGDRWIVHAEPLGLGRDGGLRGPPLAIAADVVVLSAGTLGSTEILLRSRNDGLSVSDQLGHRFTGNGDVLGFAERPDVSVRGIGLGHHPVDPEAPVGPCITGLIDHPSDSDRDRMIVEDAVIPGLLAEVVTAELATQFGAVGQSAKQGWKERLAAIGELLRGGRSGSTDHLQTFLLIGQDDDHGTLVFDDDHVRIDWPGAPGSEFYRRADQVLEEAAEQSGGTYLRDPLSTRLFHDSLITVHPLGGCVMADRAEDGVVDHRGRVFRTKGGNSVYENLVVADGSVVPLPLGVNPLLTISALTERSMALLCTERGWHSTPTEPIEPLTPKPNDGDVGLRFTERMSGCWSPDIAPSTGQLAPFLTDEQASRGLPERQVSFVLTLASNDIASVIEDLDTPMTVVGTVSAPGLSPQPLTVEQGEFQLMVADDPDPSIRHMRYSLPLASVSGERFHLEGFKVLAPGQIGEVWEATSTLYATIRRGGSDGELVGRGVLRIAPSDFARQLRTVQVLGPVGRTARLKIEAEFGLAFAGSLAHDYGSVVHRTSSFNPDAPPRRKRALDVPPPRQYECVTADGLSLPLTRYQGGRSEPVLLSHGMGNSLTWSFDTTEVSLLEYLTAHGYDVWLQEWRSSTLLPTSRTQFDGDQVARFDHPAAASVVASVTGCTNLHVVAHCVGSLTWTMAILGGTVDPSSMLCSAVAAHPIAPTITRLKVDMRLGEMLHRLGVRMLTTSSLTSESFLEHMFDRELRLYPIPKAEECDQAVCRRVAFIYGNAIHHPNINPATHAALHELFGPTNMTMMDHLSVMARAEKVQSVDEGNDYLPHLERLRRPISFLSGALNLVWLPESTKRTFDLLVENLGPDTYRRQVIDGYGHQDIFNGAAAVRDSYPYVLDHLQWVNA
jgi:cholesterol oxidase